MPAASTSYTIVPGTLVAFPGIRFSVEIEGPVKPLKRSICRCKNSGFLSKMARIIPMLINPSHHDQVKMQNAIKNCIASHITTLVFAPRTPLLLQLHFFYQRPNYHFKAGKTRNVSNLVAQQKAFHGFMVQTPDIDNCVKYVMDTPMEGVVYENDSCVVELDVKKSWDDEGECRGRSILVAVPKYIDLTAYDDENDDENIDDSFKDDDESILHVNIDEFGNEYISI